MPLRGYEGSRPNEWTRLNELLESAFHAEKDHRFKRLHEEKPIEDGWSRIYDYIPGQEPFELDISEPKIVGHFGLYNQKMQYGHSVVRNGGGRDVGTSPLVRGTGVGSQVAQDAIKFMFQNEIDFSILFSGAGHFYEKNGWRGGMPMPVFTLKKAEFEKWKESKANEASFSVDVDLINTDEDLKQLSDLYSATNEGLYFAAFRDFDYWKRHFQTRPELKWAYVGAKIEGQIKAYIRFTLGKQTDGVRVEFTECRISHEYTPNSPEMDIIFTAFLDFIQEEAIEEDTIAELMFSLSKGHQIVQHFLQNPSLILTENTGYKLNVMNIIANPYSLFEHLKDEFQWRFKQGYLPIEPGYLKFDNSWKYPGGVVFYIRGPDDDLKLEIIVAQSDIKLQSLIKGLKDGIEFKDINALNMIFCNYLPAEELEDPEELDDYGIIIKGKGLDWLIGLFKDAQYSLYGLDHF